MAASVDGTNSYQSANNQKNRKLFIRLISSDNNEVLQNLKKTMDSFPGDIEAVLVIGDSKQAIKLPMKVDYTDELKSQLVDLVGTGNIKLS